MQVFPGKFGSSWTVAVVNSRSRLINAMKSPTKQQRCVRCLGTLKEIEEIMFELAMTWGAGFWGSGKNVDFRTRATILWRSHSRSCWDIYEPDQDLHPASHEDLRTSTPALVRHFVPGLCALP
jgi:hypothetical protein